MRRSVFIVAFVLSLALRGWPSSLATAASDTPPPVSHCSLVKTADGYQGGCGNILDETPVLTLAPAPAITSGSWREDAKPAVVYAGTMTEDNHTPAIELEIYSGGRGVLRTDDGWYPVSGFATAPDLSFSLDINREVTPNAVDAKILRRAAVILATKSVWNRADDRKCPPEANTWSIYCAMAKATRDVSGGFHHRRPAMEVVREIVDERAAGHGYHHRLMGYNNDPKTTLVDVQSLFHEALADMKDPAWLEKHGFSH